MNEALTNTDLAHSITEEGDALNLTELSETNQENLKQSDDEFQPHTWEQLKDIISK